MAICTKTLLMQRGYTSSYSELSEALVGLFNETTKTTCGIRQIGIAYGGLVYENCEQLSFFVDNDKLHISLPFVFGFERVTILRAYRKE